MTLIERAVHQKSCTSTPPPDFTGATALEPIVWDEARHIAASTRTAIARRVLTTGFAVLTGPGEVTAETVTRLAGHLKLGESFLPPLYRSGTVRSAPITTIAARMAGYATHPSFGLTGGQALHTDGTLQRIGEIRTTVLACRRPAAEGGESTLFNATGAFAALAATDPAAADMLRTTDCLRRRATVNSSQESHTAPAFAVQDGMLLGRYSVGETDTWMEQPGTDVVALRRGIAFLSWASTSTTFSLQFRLAENSVLIFDNARISHGRKPYRDRADRPRLLYRGLFRSPLEASDDLR